MVLIPQPIVWKTFLHGNSGYTHIYVTDTQVSQNNRCPSCMMQCDTFYFISYIFFKSWLSLTTFISQPTDGSLWKTLNYTTNLQETKKQKVKVRKRERAHRKEGTWVRFSWHFACTWFAYVGYRWEGTKQNLEAGAHSKRHSKRGLLCLKKLQAGRQVLNPLEANLLMHMS